MDTFEISSEGSDQKPLQMSSTHSDSKIFKLAERLGVDPNRCADHVRVILTVLPVIFFALCILISGLRLNLITQAANSVAPLSTTLLQTIQFINTQGYIAELEIAQLNEECKDGYTKGEVGFWVGTQAGCFSARDNSLLPRSQCTSEDTKINGSSKAPVFKWKNTQLCFRRIPRGELKYLTEKGCGSGMKKCAQRYCIPDKYRCPISSVIVEPVNYRDPYASRQPSGSDLVYNISNWIHRKEVKFLYVEDMERLFNGFEITYSKRDCWDINDIEGSKDFNDEGKQRTVYPLLNAQPRDDHCGGYGYRNDLSVIDTMDEYEFYQLNKDKIPAYELPRLSSYSSGRKVYLNARFAPYTVSTQDCWDVDFAIVGSMKSRLEWFKNYSFFFYYSGGALSFCISGFLIYNIVMAIRYGKRVVFYAGVYLANMYFSLLLLGYFLFESFVIFAYRFWVTSASNYLRAIDGCFVDRNIRSMMRDMEMFVETEFLHKFLDDTAILMGICLIVGTIVVFCFVVLSKLRHYSIQAV